MSKGNQNLPLIVFPDGLANQAGLQIPPKFTSTVFMKAARSGTAQKYRDILGLEPYQFIPFELNEVSKTLHTPFSDRLSLVPWEDMEGADGCEHPEMGGLSSNNKKLSICDWKHYSSNCNYNDCFRFDTDADGRANIDGARVIIDSDALATSLWEDLKFLIVMGQFYEFDRILPNYNAGINEAYWKQFKKSLERCKGHLASTNSVDAFTDAIITVLSDTKKSDEELAEALSEVFDTITESSDYDLDDVLLGNGENAMPYYNVSIPVYRLAKRIAKGNNSKGENGCTNVCNNFTSEGVGTSMIIYYKGVPLYPENAKNKWDHHLLIEDKGVKKQMRFWDITYTVSKNLVWTGRGNRIMDNRRLPIIRQDARTGVISKEYASVYVAPKPGLKTTAYEYFAALSGGAEVMEDNLAIRGSAFIPKTAK